MKLNRLMALALMMSIGTALFVWSHAQAKAHKTVNASRNQSVRDENSSLTLTGVVFPVITTPLSSRHMNLTVPLNTWVNGGQVIGTAESHTDPGRETVPGRKSRRPGPRSESRKTRFARTKKSFAHCSRKPAEWTVKNP